MFVLCKCDDEIIKKFLESVTKDTIIYVCKILTSHFSIKSLSSPNKINARANLGIPCKQDVLKQNKFAVLENNLNETGSFNLQSLISFSVNICISFDTTRRAYDGISHDDSFIDNLFSYNKMQID